MSALFAPVSGTIRALKPIFDTRYLKRRSVCISIVSPWYTRSSVVMPGTGQIRRVIETPYPIADLDDSVRRYRTAIDLELVIQEKPMRVMMIVVQRYLDRAIPLACTRGERVLGGCVLARAYFGMMIDLYLPMGLDRILVEEGMRVSAGETYLF